MSTNKHFESESQAGVTIMRIKDHEFLDRLIGSELQNEMIEYVQEEKPSKLLISFERVQRFSSETINALLRSREYVNADGGQVKLCEMRPEIRKVFQLMKLEGTVFEIYDSAVQAIDSF